MSEKLDRFEFMWTAHVNEMINDGGAENGMERSLEWEPVNLRRRGNRINQRNCPGNS